MPYVPVGIKETKKKKKYKKTVSPAEIELRDTGVWGQLSTSYNTAACNCI